MAGKLSTFKGGPEMANFKSIFEEQALVNFFKSGANALEKMGSLDSVYKRVKDVAEYLIKNSLASNSLAAELKKIRRSAIKRHLLKREIFVSFGQGRFYCILSKTSGGVVTDDAIVNGNYAEYEDDLSRENLIEEILKANARHIETFLRKGVNVWEKYHLDDKRSHSVHPSRKKRAQMYYGDLVE